MILNTTTAPGIQQFYQFEDDTSNTGQHVIYRIAVPNAANNVVLHFDVPLVLKRGLYWTTSLAQDMTLTVSGWSE